MVPCFNPNRLLHNNKVTAIKQAAHLLLSQSHLAIHLAFNNQAEGNSKKKVLSFLT
jgi:hypothetical protein